MANSLLVEDMQPRTTWLPLDGSFLQKAILEEIIGAVQDLYDQMIAITGSEIELALPDYPADFQVDYASAAPFVLIYDTLHIARKRLRSLVNATWGLRDSSDPYYVNGTKWSFHDFWTLSDSIRDLVYAATSDQIPAAPHTWKQAVEGLRAAIELVTEIRGRYHKRFFELCCAPEGVVTKTQRLKRRMTNENCLTTGDLGNYWDYNTLTYHPYDPQTVECYGVADAATYGGFPGYYGDMPQTYEDWLTIEESPSSQPIVYAWNRVFNNWMPPHWPTTTGVHIDELYQSDFEEQFDNLWAEEKLWFTTWFIVPQHITTISIQMTLSDLSEPWLPCAEFPADLPVAPDVVVTPNNNFFYGVCSPWYGGPGPDTAQAGYNINYPEEYPSKMLRTFSSPPLYADASFDIEVNLDDTWPELGATPLVIDIDSDGVLTGDRYKTELRPTNEGTSRRTWIVGRAFTIEIGEMPARHLRASVDHNDELRDWEIKNRNTWHWEPFT